MDRTQINPWSWQVEFGYSQGWRVDGPTSVLFIAGQVALAPDGSLVGEGDFDAQCRQVFENLKTVLAQAGATFEHVVKVTVYMTDITNRSATARSRRSSSAGLSASTSLEVKSLAFHRSWWKSKPSP